MSKSSKIMIAIIAAVLVVCAAAVAIVSVVMSHENKSTTDANGQVVVDVSTTTATTTTEVDLSQEILGSWSDSSGMMGFNFHDDNTVDITYVNLTVPVVNIPINGSATGTYTLDGNELKVNYSIYSGNIDTTYNVVLSGNTLTLTDKEDGDTTVMTRGGEAITVSDTTESTTATTTTEATTSDNEENSIIGCWKSSDNKVQYTFYENGQVNIKFFGDDSESEFDGVYILDDETVTVQYTSDGKSMTNKYKYTVSGLSMSLENDNGDTTLFVKTAGESEVLLGKWSDSSGMSGFEFKENGVVDVTYVNLTVPVVNIPINGTFTGTYSVDGDTVTVNYSIYSTAASSSYYFKVSGNTLTLTNVEDGEVSTYVKQS